MALYIMLTRLTDQGARTVKQHPEHILEVNGQLEDMGLKVLHQYAVLGRYDFVNVVEAADDAAVARASLELGARGSIRIETLAAMPAEELIGAVKE
ncbi:MAG: GYD domain-containing protein [Coriobacteriia bacterium]|nr:GYD domain-containing protein [Coriobacteriia bacterium]